MFPVHVKETATATSHTLKVDVPVSGVALLCRCVKDAICKCDFDKKF